ncbi:unnamed protein product [Prunus armeniaca]
MRIDPDRRSLCFDFPIVKPMVTIGVDFLRYMGLVSGSRDYQLFGGRRLCLCPFLAFSLPTWSLQALRGLGGLDVLRMLLIEQLLGFVHFRRE